MDYKERQEITANKEITTMRMVGMSISFMTILMTFLLSLTHIDNNSIIIIVSVFILGLTLVLSYISIGTKIENSARCGHGCKPKLALAKHPKIIKPLKFID